MGARTHVALVARPLVVDLVMVDLETTELSPAASDISQLSSGRVRLGNILHAESFSTFVKSLMLDLVVDLELFIVAACDL